MHKPKGRVHMRLSGDPRLVAGVGGAVQRMAERAGLGEAAAAALASATEEACQNTFPLLQPSDPFLSVGVFSFHDHLEVTVEHRGVEEPSAGLDTFLRGGGETTGLDLMARVDRVQYDTAGGTSRTTLIKYLEKK
jgi:anti-sigma regulatory factor (Ser/Thr protein kinase)